MGEAVLKDISRKRGLDIIVDSAGIAGYHVGEEPDERYELSNSPRYRISSKGLSPGLYSSAKRYPQAFSSAELVSVSITCQYDVPITCLARKVVMADFTSFTHILASDESNLRDLMRKKPSNSTADIRLWGAYLDNKPIQDPYYGTMVSDNVLLTTVNPNHTSGRV